MLLIDVCCVNCASNCSLVVTGFLLLFVVCCVLVVVCCLLDVDCDLLLVVCCLLLCVAWLLSRVVGCCCFVSCVLCWLLFVVDVWLVGVVFGGGVV